MLIMNLSLFLEFPTFNTTYWTRSRQKNRKQTVNKGLPLFFYGTDATTIKLLINQMAWFKDWICAGDPSLFRCFDVAEKLDEMWMGRPVYNQYGRICK